MGLSSQRLASGRLGLLQVKQGLMAGQVHTANSPSCSAWGLGQVSQPPNRWRPCRRGAPDVCRARSEHLTPALQPFAVQPWPPSAPSNTNSRSSADVCTTPLLTKGIALCSSLTANISCSRSFTLFLTTPTKSSSLSFKDPNHSKASPLPSVSVGRC